MTRDLWAAWRRLVGAALGLSLGGMTLSWVLYLPGLITADRFVEALFGSLLVLAVGVLGASVWLVPKVRSYRKHLNSLGATPPCRRGMGGSGRCCWRSPALPDPVPNPFPTQQEHA